MGTGFKADIERCAACGRSGGGNDIHDSIGFNFKFTELQAAIGIEQMKKLTARDFMMLVGSTPPQLLDRPSFLAAMERGFACTRFAMREVLAHPLARRSALLGAAFGPIGGVWLSMFARQQAERALLLLQPLGRRRPRARRRCW